MISPVISSVIQGLNFDQLTSFFQVLKGVRRRRQVFLLGERFADEQMFSLGLRKP